MLKRSGQILVTVLLLYILIFAIMTYPLIFNFTRFMPGFFSTDESYAIVWSAWFYQFANAHDLSLLKTDFLSFPYGVDLYSCGSLGLLLFLINYGLALIASPILTYNIQILGNFLLSAMSIFFLVRYLTRSALAAFLSGLIFSCSPYFFMRSWQHLGDTYQWPLFIFVFTLIRVFDNPTSLNRTLFVAGFALLTLGFNIIYAPVCFLVFLALLLLLSVRKKAPAVVSAQPIKRIVFLAIIGSVVVSFQVLPFILQSLRHRHSTPAAFNPYVRPFEDLFNQSAQPLSYFLPAVVHPLFGRFTQLFVGSRLYGSSITEHTLYLGWLPLFLAALAFRRWKKRGVLRDSGPAADQRYDMYTAFFLILAVAAWLFSQPPWRKIGPLTLYLPSFFMYKLIPTLRAYSRFGAVVMFAVAVLAGLGLHSFLKNMQSSFKRFCITGVCCLGVLFEFWNYPPFNVINAEKAPQAYYWLKSQPADIILAEYPLDLGSPSEMYKMYQMTHQKKMINFIVPGSAADKNARQLTRLSDYSTVQRLKEMGVSYVFVHRSAYERTELTVDSRELAMIRENPGLRYLRSFPAQGCLGSQVLCIEKSGPIDVYEIKLPNTSR